MKLFLLLLFLVMTGMVNCQGWNPKVTCPDSPYFRFQDESGKYGIVDSKGKVVKPGQKLDL